MQTLKLNPPHGWLMWRGKKIAIANDEPLDINEPFLVVSNGEAFGTVELNEPAQMKSEVFDNPEWLEKHRIYKRERRQFWPEANILYVHSFKSWEPLEQPKLFKDGKIIDEPELTREQEISIAKGKQLPKQINLKPDMVLLAGNNDFIIEDDIIDNEELKSALEATYEIEVKCAEIDGEEDCIPLYSLALVRNPRMTVTKKNSIAAEKQEGDDMPWEIEARGEEFCVIKVDGGEVEGCHPTRDEAQAQLAALNIAEDEGDKQHSAEQFLRMIREQFNDQFATSEMDEIIRHDMWVMDIFDNAVFPSMSGFLVVEWDGILYRVEYVATENGVTFASVDQWIEVEIDYRPKGFKLLKHYDKAKPDLPEQARSDGFVSKLKNAANALGELVGLIETTKPQSEPDLNFETSSGFAIKTVDGKPWHFTWSTNAFQDREKEIFSTKTLEQYVAESEAKEHKGFFNLWHINDDNGGFNTDFAEKQWQAVIGRFLVESGPYLDSHQGRSALKFFEQYPNGHPDISPEGWGCSPEYKYVADDREDGVYDWIDITRTSTLPRGMAANIWTEAGQAENKMALSDQQLEAANAMFGEEFVSGLLTEADKRTQELEEANVAHKGENGEDDKPSNPEIDVNELAKAVSGHFDVNFSAISEILTEIKGSTDKLTERVATLEADAETRQKAEAPRFVWEMRASQADETEADESLKDKKPQETNSPGSGSKVMDAIFPDRR